MHGNSNIKYKWVVNATPRPLYPGKETRDLLYRGLGGYQGQSGRMRKISPPPTFDPRTIQPVAIAIPSTLSRPAARLGLELNTFAASYLNTQGLNNSCLKSPASTLVDLTFQSRVLRSFSLNQLRNLSL